MGAKLVLDSDTHEPSDLLTIELAKSIARGAGLSGDEETKIIENNPLELLELIENSKLTTKAT